MSGAMSWRSIDSLQCGQVFLFVTSIEKAQHVEAEQPARREYLELSRPLALMLNSVSQ